MAGAAAAAAPGPAPHAYERELGLALAAVERASGVCVAVRQSLFAGTGDAAFIKGDKSPVTAADFAIQALISLTVALPTQTPLVAEEDSAALRADAPLAAKTLALVREAAGDASITAEGLFAAVDVGQFLSEPPPAASGAAAAGDAPPAATRYWICDPVDGTRGFSGDSPAGQWAQYAVGLCLVDRGEVVLAVLGLPNWTPAEARGPAPGGGPAPPDAEPASMRAGGAAPPRGMVVFAVKGRGSWQYPYVPPAAGAAISAAPRPALTPMRVAPQPPGGLRGATVQIADWETWPMLSAVSQIVTPARVWSVAQGSLIKEAAVALGDAHIFLQNRMRWAPFIHKVWDHAAGVLVVEEAGGRATDYRGNPLRLAAGTRMFAPAGDGLMVTIGGALHDEMLAAFDKARIY